MDSKWIFSVVLFKVLIRGELVTYKAAQMAVRQSKYISMMGLQGTDFFVASSFKLVFIQLKCCVNLLAAKALVQSRDA